jgi:hypothetical protein
MRSGLLFIRHSIEFSILIFALIDKDVNEASKHSWKKADQRPQQK